MHDEFYIKSKPESTALISDQTHFYHRAIFYIKRLYMQVLFFHFCASGDDEASRERKMLTLPACEMG